MGKRKKGQLSILGANSITVNQNDPETMIVGTESGSIFKCKVTVSNQLFGQESGPFDNAQTQLWWSEQAASVMNMITSKGGDKIADSIAKIIATVERYCMDKGIKEVMA